MGMRITRDAILAYAGHYDARYGGTDAAGVEAALKKKLGRQGYLTREDLIGVGRWKSRRAGRHYADGHNDDLTVREITRFCLSARSEKARIGGLLALRGVSWAVGSTILDFARPDRYPIMDFRVIESLGWRRPGSYTFEFWERYCARVRGIAEAHGVDLRAHPVNAQAALCWLNILSFRYSSSR
jgi:hypothetical protein